MDVWVVGRLHYGDEEVIGIFSSEEAARRVCEDQHGNDSSTKSPYAFTVAQWTVDAPVHEGFGREQTFQDGKWLDE